MKEKLLYTAPEAELLVVRFEENILSAGDQENGTEKGHVVNPGSWGW